jgi:hypothetical protein
MPDRVIPLSDLELAGYSRAELRERGVVERVGHDGIVCYDRAELRAAGVAVPEDEDD